MWSKLQSRLLLSIFIYHISPVVFAAAQDGLETETETETVMATVPSPCVSDDFGVGGFIIAGTDTIPIVIGTGLDSTLTDGFAFTLSPAALGAPPSLSTDGPAATSAAATSAAVTGAPLSLPTPPTFATLAPTTATTTADDSQQTGAAAVGAPCPDDVDFCIDCNSDDRWVCLCDTSPFGCLPPGLGFIPSLGDDGEAECHADFLFIDFCHPCTRLDAALCFPPGVGVVVITGPPGPPGGGGGGGGGGNNGQPTKDQPTATRTEEQQQQSSSSGACTSTVATSFSTYCTPVTAGSTVSQSCTVTSTLVTGCSVTGAATATTASAGPACPLVTGPGTVIDPNDQGEDGFPCDVAEGQPPLACDGCDGRLLPDGSGTAVCFGSFLWCYCTPGDNTTTAVPGIGPSGPGDGSGSGSGSGSGAGGSGAGGSGGNTTSSVPPPAPSTSSVAPPIVSTSKAPATSAPPASVPPPPPPPPPSSSSRFSSNIVQPQPKPTSTLPPCGREAPPLDASKCTQV